jgi:hypothetical protein
MKKRCSKCEIEKEFEAFGKGNGEHGLRYDCKECRRAYNEMHKEQIQARNKKYYSTNKEVLLIQSREYQQKNKSEIKEQRRNYRIRNKEHIIQKRQEYNPIRLHRIKERRKVDLGFRLQEIVRSKVHRMLKGIDTSYKTLVGCSEEILKKWLEFQFDGQMTWDNLGTYWHIDHILPINKFDLDSNPDAKFICFNWKNLQPLPAFENQSKSDSIQLHYYFNSIVTIHRFIQCEKLDPSEYQGVRESLRWLREKLGYGNKLVDDGVSKETPEMDNPQPSPYRTVKSHGEGSTTTW